MQKQLAIIAASPCASEAKESVAKLSYTKLNFQMADSTDEFAGIHSACVSLAASVDKLALRFASLQPYPQAAWITAGIFQNIPPTSPKNSALILDNIHQAVIHNLAYSQHKVYIFVLKI